LRWRCRSLTLGLGLLLTEERLLALSSSSLMVNHLQTLRAAQVLVIERGASSRSQSSRP
jgi:hypothetical protein